MKRKILIPISAEEVTEHDNLAELQSLGITIDEVRALLTEWVRRNVGLSNMRDKTERALRMGWKQKNGHISHTDLFLFRAENKLDNGLPEDIL